MQDRQQILRQSGLLLEKFADLIGHRFDRQRAERILYESHLNESSKADEDWMETVRSCAEALEFRIRRIRTSLDEVIELVNSGIPVAFLVAASPKANLNDSSATAAPRWVLITGSRGRRLKIHSLENSQSKWTSQGEVMKLIGLANPHQEASWLVSYPALMHDASTQHLDNDADHEEHHSDLSPFRRLLGILRAEWSDIFVIVVFSVVVGVLTLTTPIAVEALVNTLAFGQFTQPVLVLAFIVLVLLSFSSALTAISTYSSEIIQRRLFVRLVEDLAYRLPRVEKSRLDRSSLPELTNRFLDVVTIQKSVSKLLLDGIVIILQTIIGMGVLAFYHPFLLGFDVMLLLLIAFTLFVLGQGAVRTAIGESIQKFQMLAWLEEVGGNPTAFRFNDGWEFAVNRADHLAVAYLDARKKHFRIVFRQVVVSLGIYCIATTVLLGLGGWLVISGELSLGQLVAAELIVILIVRSFAKLGKHMESFYELMAAVDKVGLLLDLPMFPHDKLLTLDANQPIKLELDQVALSLAGTTHVSNFNLMLESGEHAAVLASPDVDLRSLAGLCLGDRSPDTGRVLINNIDLDEYRTDSIRSAFGYASSPDVFSGTLEENVHLNRAGISLLEVRNVIELVGLKPSVDQLPHGLQTRVEPGGFPLSPLQTNRLMLARALVSNPRVLIIDGVLDSFGEADFTWLAQNLFASARSVIIFTHDPAVAKLAGKFVKLDNLEKMEKTRDLH